MSVMFNSLMPSLNSRSLPFVVFLGGFPSRCQNLSSGAIMLGGLLFVNVLFFKWSPVAIVDVQKPLLTISDQYHNIYFCDFFTKWLPAAILDVQSSLVMAFLAISDQYETFFSKYLYKMATGIHFGCQKFTF